MLEAVFPPRRNLANFPSTVLVDVGNLGPTASSLVWCGCSFPGQPAGEDVAVVLLVSQRSQAGFPLEARNIGDNDASSPKKQASMHLQTRRLGPLSGLLLVARVSSCAGIDVLQLSCVLPFASYIYGGIYSTPELLEPVLRPLTALY